MDETFRLREAFGQQGVARSQEHHRILLIKSFNQVVAPDPLPDRVNCFISLRFEKLSPVRQMLWVYVIFGLGQVWLLKTECMGP